MKEATLTKTSSNDEFGCELPGSYDRKLWSKTQEEGEELEREQAVLVIKPAEPGVRN